MKYINNAINKWETTCQQQLFYWRMEYGEIRRTL